MRADRMARARCCSRTAIITTAGGGTAPPDDVYRQLVARGAQVPIGMAALKGELARVRALLDADPSLVNRVDDYKAGYAGAGAPIKNAAIGGRLEIVTLLLERGADPNLPEEGNAPLGHALYAAVMHRRYEIAQLLLEHGAYPNPPVESSADAVWIAIRSDDLKMIQLLASYGAAWELPIDLVGALTYEQIVSTGIERTLSVLAHYGDVDTAETLLAANPARADDPEALSSAANHEAFVRLLLRYQPDLAKKVTVARPRHVAELLFAHGMDANRPNWLRSTPLHQFAGNGQIEEAELLLDHGADLHARDEEYRSTPLAWAARAGQVRMVEFLLRRGARPSVPDDPPWATAKAWATRRGHEPVVRLLDGYERSGTLPLRRLDRYESLARDLVEAFGPGDAAALQRIVEYFRAERAIAWDRPPHDVLLARLRRAVVARLTNASAASTAGAALPLEEARWLIAQAEGCTSWQDLAAEVARLSPPGSTG